MSTAPNPQPNIHIRHTAAEGTIASGDFGREDRDVHQALKSAGFRYSRNVGWYIQGSRDQRPRLHVINRAADALRALGWDVTVEVETGLRPMVERETARVERSEDRVEALTAKAERKASEAEATLARASEMADAIPFGQPMLTDHYSYKRDCNYRDKIQRTYGKGFETLEEARETERRAQAAQQNQEHRESPGTTLRRIEKLEAESRKYERELTPCPVSGKKTKPEAEGRTITCLKCYSDVTATGGQFSVHNVATGRYAERLQQRIEEIADEVAYWRQHLADLEAKGVKLWGPDDFEKDDMARTRFGLHRVVRVNKKSLSVESYFSCTVPYDKVTGRVAKADLSEGL